MLPSKSKCCLLTASSKYCDIKTDAIIYLWRRHCKPCWKSFSLWLSCCRSVANGLCLIVRIGLSSKCNGTNTKIHWKYFFKFWFLKITIHNYFVGVFIENFSNVCEDFWGLLNCFRNAPFRLNDVRFQCCFDNLCKYCTIVRLHLFWLICLNQDIWKTIRSFLKAFRSFF